MDRADRSAVPGAPRARGHHTGTDAHEDAACRWQRAFTDIDAHRILQASDAAKGLLHPAAAKVIATLNNEWDGLARHQDLPQLPLDNNIAERALRTPVIGRKNFYGSGAQWAAHLAADIWTTTATAARHDIEPLSLLTGYLRECARNGGTAPAEPAWTIPALDTPRTRPPLSRRRSGSRPVTPAIRSPANPAHVIPPHAAEDNFAMPSPPTPQHDLPRVPRLLTQKEPTEDHQRHWRLAAHRAMSYADDSGLTVEEHLRRPWVRSWC